jgi:hypothetical protein
LGLADLEPDDTESTAVDRRTYSVAAGAELLDVYPGTIWLWLRRGVLSGH